MKSPMISVRVAGLVAGGLLIACGSGCTPAGSHVLGQAPGEPSANVASLRQNAGSQPVTVCGIMVEKCPEAGCWFVLKDASGSIRVDTKTAGFVVVEVPLNRQLTVVGQRITNGTDVLLAATGVRY